MPYTPELYKEPFWAKSGDFIRGRDPLGIQNSSISTYSRLLPGMTNLTLRIRYYGFYLWLLQEYHNLPDSSPFKKNYRGQYNFIRRAELALAFVMVNLFEDVQSVVGSNFAYYHKELEEAQYYDLKKGADKLPWTIKGSVYWDYSSGAMGQYYSGALITFGLVFTNESYFIKTEKGEKLADAYRKSISKKTRELFLDCIKTGKLFSNYLAGFSEFAVHKIPLHSDEWEFYQSLMLENDGDYFRTSEHEIPRQRVETISHFLVDNNLLKDKTQWEEFPLRMYQNQGYVGTQNQTDASIGWYYYYMNELVHFCLETIFWALLKEMDGKEYRVEYFVENLVSNVLKEIQEMDKQADTELTIEELLQGKPDEPIPILENISYINEAVKKQYINSAIILAVQFLIELYKENKEHLSMLENYSVLHSVNDKNGNVIGVFNQLLLTNAEKKFPEFLRTCFLRIMNDHISIALKKMGNGERNLLKFLVEDNRLIHVENIEPRFTSPRLRALRNIMTDLHYMNKEGEVTETGHELLNRLNEYHERKKVVF